MRKLLILMLGIVANVNAQLHYQYPENQEFYEGGSKVFYTELAQIMKDKNFQYCENPNEAITVKVIVNPNGKIQFVTEEDQNAVNNNQCAYNMIKEALKYLKNWKPAEVDGNKIRAIARFGFVPNDLLNGITEFSAKDFKKPDYPKGVEKFRNRYIACFHESKFQFPADIDFTLFFEINTQGNIQLAHIEPIFNNVEFNKMALGCLNYRERKIKWTPASYKGTPIISLQNFKIKIFSY